MALPRSVAQLGLVIGVEDDPDPDDIAVIDDRVAAFTIAAAAQGPPQPLGVFARRDGTCLAGIHGWTWGGCCELVSLWVDEPLRRRGVGRVLLSAAEAAAYHRGCRQVVLLTHAVQAPRFYMASGYELVGEVDGYPAGSAAHWFRKRLDQRPRPEPGASGTIAPR